MHWDGRVRTSNVVHIRPSPRLALALALTLCVLIRFGLGRLQDVDHSYEAGAVRRTGQQLEALLVRGGLLHCNPHHRRGVAWIDSGSEATTLVVVTERRRYISS